MSENNGNKGSRTNDISKIAQIAVPVQDIDRAVNFYKVTLQPPFSFSTPNMAFFDCGGARMVLSILEKEKFSQASSVICFKVEDIHKPYQEL
jgi:predicted enzyme related to lactoylglutathione lyase